MVEEPHRTLWSQLKACKTGGGTIGFGGPEGELRTCITLRRGARLTDHFERVLDRYGMEVVKREHKSNKHTLVIIDVAD